MDKWKKEKNKNKNITKYYEEKIIPSNLFKIEFFRLLTNQLSYNLLIILSR